MTTQLPIGLDIGCGNAMEQHSMRMFPGFHWVGLDKADFRSAYPAGTFVQHDLRYSLPYEENSIDLVFSHHCLEHLPPMHPDWDKPGFTGARDFLVFVVNDMWRVLKPGHECHIIVPWIEHTNAWRSPTHYRFFNKDYWGYFSSGYPVGDHEGEELSAKWRIARNEIVDECHIYAILIKQEWESVEEMAAKIGCLRPMSAPWLPS